MAIVFVQHTSNASNGAFALAATFPATTTAGNLIVVGSRVGDQGLTSVACTDDVGNTYQQATSSYFATLGSGFIFYCRNAAPANTITVTVTGGTTPTNRFVCHEYSGCDKITPFDVATSQSQAGTATPSSGNVTTSEDNELLFGMIGVSNTRTITGGTNIAWVFDEQLPAGAGAGKVGIEHFLAANTAGTFAANFNLNAADDCVTTIATFRQAQATQGVGGDYTRLFFGVGV